jgi:hypothetical protein
MILSELKNCEIRQLLQEIKDAEVLQYVAPDTMLREYMDTLNPTVALIQAPIDIWKEASNRWVSDFESMENIIQGMRQGMQEELKRYKG